MTHRGLSYGCSQGRLGSTTGEPARAGSGALRGRHTRRSAPRSPSAPRRRTPARRSPEARTRTRTGTARDATYAARLQIASLSSGAPPPAGRHRRALLQEAQHLGERVRAVPAQHGGRHLHPPEPGHRPGMAGEPHRRTGTSPVRWMMGVNPQLEDYSPLQAIAVGRLKDVMDAAHSHRHGDL